MRERDQIMAAAQQLQGQLQESQTAAAEGRAAVEAREELSQELGRLGKEMEALRQVHCGTLCEKKTLFVSCFGCVVYWYEWCFRMVSGSLTAGCMHADVLVCM